MSTYRLQPRDGSATFQKITTGKKWVGRVGRCEDGRFFGKIGKTFIYAGSAGAAFDEVVAQHLGYASADELRSRNATVRAKNHQRRAVARYAGNEMLAGNFQPFFDLLTNDR